MIAWTSQRFAWWRRHTVKTRVTLFTLIVFLVSIWTLFFFADRTLRRDIQDLLGKQQLLTATLLAAEVNHDIEIALRSLHLVATRITPEMMADRESIQKLIESLPVFQDRFTAGAFVTGLDGEAIASVPVSANRLGVKYGDRDYISEVLKTGKPHIGKPVVGRTLNVPIFGIGYPIFDADKKVIGVLAGGIFLQDSKALVALHKAYLAEDERFLIVDTRHRLIAAGSDLNRVMEQLPPPGVNPPLDKFINGYEGTDVFVSPVGDKVLASVKSIPIAGWYAAVVLPVQVAYAPIKKLERELLVAAMLLSIIASGLTWWMLRRQLAPLQKIAAKLSSFSESDRIDSKINNGRDDEIGRLIQAFNKLLDDLAYRQKLLQENTELHQVAFRTSPDAVSITRLSDGRYLDVNDGFTRLFGWTREEVVGHTSSDLAIWKNFDDRKPFLKLLNEKGYCENFEATFLTKERKEIPSVISGMTMTWMGEPCLLAITHDISVRKAALEEIQELSFSDSLTGLPNRRFYSERFKQSLSGSIGQHRLSALIFIDLDNFKSLNESFGHDKGDLLIKRVAKRIKECGRDEDVVMRIGGDKFLVLVENLTEIEQGALSEIQRLIEKLLNELAQPYYLNGLEHFSTCSIGVTLFGDKEERDSEVLNRAELAMYQAKSAGRNTWRLYEPQMQHLVSARATLELNLRDALSNNQFVLYYQAQVDEFGIVVGVEALIRWQSPQHGLVSPGVFISLAEETGLIIPIGEWAIESACQQLAIWSARADRSNLTIAVNVSANQFGQSDFVQKVKGFIERTKINPQRLKLELTESVLIHQIDAVVDKMNKLKEIGVQFSLDDFGTGFSSLAYLKRLPLNQLKIDQGFVQDILVDSSDESIAKTVIDLGKSLGLSVIAEGVETQAQRNTLYAMGCKLYQGYFYGKPMPISELESNLSQTKE